MVVVQHANARIEYETTREEPLAALVAIFCSVSCTLLSHPLSFSSLFFLTAQRLHAPGDPTQYCLQLEATKQYLEEGDLARLDSSLPPGAVLLLKMKPPLAVQSALSALADTTVSQKQRAIQIFEIRNALKVRKLRDTLSYSNLFLISCINLLIFWRMNCMRANFCPRVG